MSSTRSIVVNCGSTQVGVAVFTANAGRLTLERLVVEDLVYDFAVEDAWLGALTAKLSEIVRALKLEGPASLVVPGYQLLTKTIRVPQVEKARQSQIIGFEAQNQIPYPLSEVVWDSQIIGTDGVEAEVMLFALKQDAAARLVGAVTAAGLSPTGVEASTLMDYQAWRAAAPGDTDDVLLINVGARTINMTFAGSTGFSVHNINLGGNYLTQQISDALALPFSVAEVLKVAYFSGEKTLDATDAHAAEMLKQSQSFQRKVSQEVTKRIVNFKRQNQGRAPAKIILTGRGALLPGLSEHLCDTQRISVEFFDPALAFARSAAVDATYVEACRFQLGELLGEGSRAILPNAVGVNLIPATLANAMAFDKRKPLFVVAAALFAIAPWPVFMHFNGLAGDAAKATATVSARIAELKKNRDALATGGEDITKARDTLAALHGASLASGAWRNFLADLQQRVGGVENVWIDELQFHRAKGKPPVPAEGESTEGKPAPFVPDQVTVTVSLRMLITEVKPGGAFNRAAYTARRNAVFQALKRSPFVADIPTNREKYDTTQSNLPRLTLSLVIKPDYQPL